jgi:diaminohydroxyphosphoribosylaminopyrimidine deaminase/5-amino-6-(5-phosphoribosylamino)uracil reductase
VQGGGGRRLLEAGVKVETGLHWQEAWELNRGFFHQARSGLPWVVMKAAMSLDGKICDSFGVSQWITSAKSRSVVHRLRAHAGAVLVGSGTALADNPGLTNRMAPPIRRQPLKAVLDSKLTIDPESRLVREDPEQLMLFCNETGSSEKEALLTGKGVRVVRLPSPERPDPEEVLKILGGMGVQSVLVEGGRGIFTSFMERQLIDEYYLFYGPMLLGGEKAVSLLGGAGLSLNDAPRLTIQATRRIGGDLLVHAVKEGSVPQCIQALSKK